MTLRDYKHVHCIGIGGIGLSALARYCKAQGAKVTGSDGSTSRITEDLEKEGVAVSLGHSASHVPKDADLVLYTIAIGDSNPEFVEAHDRGIVCMSYPEALGKLTEEYETIAVCGTHGKTTTTAMVASALTACGESPTVIVGSLLSEHGTNFIQGTGKYLVVEACEYRRSFLHLSPAHVIVTNIDTDHLDYYKDLDDIKSAFQSFVDKIPQHGKLITHPEVELRTAGEHIRVSPNMSEGIALSVLGVHNKDNASLVLTLTHALGLDDDASRAGLKAFTGTWRRLEYKGKTAGGVQVYDDYGHHPTELRATLSALRSHFTSGEYMLHVLFQPHLFSRTKDHFEEFVESFGDADHVYFAPIYRAREAFDETVTSEMLAERVLGSRVLHAKDEAQHVLDSLTSKDVFVTIGAGDVYTWVTV
jgi:UDP-N-acetylmuramate--alanine ligase